MKTVLTRAARKDIDKAAEYYEIKQEGLGMRFLDRVDEALDKISLNPLGFAKFAGENRRINLETFPYALFFKIKEDAIVVACLYGGRNPRVIKDRARGVIPFPE